ncbi:DUF2283 domain-containing protein [Desulfatitalea alkaliphila]|uniref:DUF2283 domain-containing protein n=1 Tax=Desulfatitalea alkaliphila TaxID=2929485 RepID=A0AA41R3R4_9BACT|nr:DUF2283 domain-containing protein [Desulfatitalea alkaliphila]MCJ8502489.1 DUF2283 domain-containing protein [Desulfatitalea alkaliphila]
MAALKIYFDAEAKTLTVWFDNPENEFIAEETGQEVILIKDKDGKVIGFERLHYEMASIDDLTIEAVAI